MITHFSAELASLKEDVAILLKKQIDAAAEQERIQAEKKKQQVAAEKKRQTPSGKKQRVSIAYRNRTANAEGAKFAGGSAEPLAYIGTMATLTEERCYELVEEYMR